MPGIKRTRAQKIKDRETIATLRLQALTLEQIVQQTGLSKSTVQRTLRELQAEWQARAAAATDEVKARELAKLDQLERETWSEWHRSKEDWVKKSVKKGGDVAGVKSSPETKVDTGGQCGDPRYLNVLLGIQERRAKLLGIEAPQKIAGTNPDGTEERPLGSYVFPVPPGLDIDAWRQLAAQAAAKSGGP